MNIIETIADEVATSGAQRKAAIAAMSRLQDLTLRGDRDDTLIVEPTGAPARLAFDTDYVLFVLNGKGSNLDDTLTVKATLRDVCSRGSVTVVTTGRMGVEVEAQKLAKALGARHVEVGAVWQRPNPDGTTTRMPSARQSRNKTLREACAAYVADGGRAFVLCYGEEASNDTIEKVLVEAGARPRKASRYHVEPDPAPAPPAPAPIVMEA